MISVDSSPFDPENPWSLFNLVPAPIKEAVENIDPRFYSYSEMELRQKAKPTAQHCRIRISFWDEYLRAVEQKRPMYISSIIKGACSPEFFYSTIIRNQQLLAYITIPPADYQLALREMLELGWDRMREVLMMPMTSKVPVQIRTKDEETGKIITTTELIETPNTKLIAEMRAIVQQLDQRIKGAVMQRMQIDQRNLNLNVNSPPGASDSFLPTTSMEQLEAMSKKIQAMKSEMQEVELLSEAKEDDGLGITIDDAAGESTEDGSFLSEE